MALDLEQKNKIIYYLGLAGKTLIEDSTHYNSIVASRLKNLNVYIEDEVDTLLTDIDATRTRLKGTSTKGNVKRIGDIELDTNRSRSMVTTEYKRLIRELSSLLDIPSMNSFGSMSNVCL